MITGVAFIAGPVIGSTLYGEDNGEPSTSKYIRPFLVMGILVASLAAIGPFAVKFAGIPMSNSNVDDGGADDNGDKKEDPGYINTSTIILNPRVLLAAIGCLLWTTGGGFLEPTIGQHLIDWLGISGWKLGLMFVIPACCYALTAPIIGAVTEASGNPFAILGGGLMLLGLAYSGLGPAPFYCPCILKNEISLPVKYVIQVAAMILFGLSLGMVRVPNLYIYLYGMGFVMCSICHW